MSLSIEKISLTPTLPPALPSSKVMTTRRLAMGAVIATAALTAAYLAQQYFAPKNALMSYPTLNFQPTCAPVCAKPPIQPTTPIDFSAIAQKIANTLFPSTTIEKAIALATRAPAQTLIILPTANQESIHPQRAQQIELPLTFPTTTLDRIGEFAFRSTTNTDNVNLQTQQSSYFYDFFSSALETVTTTHSEAATHLTTVANSVAHLGNRLADNALPIIKNLPSVCSSATGVIQQRAASYSNAVTSLSGLATKTYTTAALKAKKTVDGWHDNARALIASGVKTAATESRKLLARGAEAANNLGSKAITSLTAAVESASNSLPTLIPEKTSTRTRVKVVNTETPNEDNLDTSALSPSVQEGFGRIWAFVKEAATTARDLTAIAANSLIETIDPYSCTNIKNIQKKTLLSQQEWMAKGCYKK